MADLSGYYTGAIHEPTEKFKAAGGNWCIKLLVILCYKVPVFVNFM